LLKAHYYAPTYTYNTFLFNFYCGVGSSRIS